MRDDFLFRCQKLESLRDVFFDLTPLGPLEGPALREALQKPAEACGYRFEEGLVEEMVREVEKLPLLAFAAAELWEKRERERKVLTRSAYEEIGRAGGALAQHAERTLQTLGAESQPTVRGVFRNLTTSQGTRVSMGKDELLSIFPDGEKEKAGSVLARLVDARLLTSSESGVEIVHESLLTVWPRLTQWQAQDAEGTVLRDQLRQAARLWEERGRADDLLWTGTSYRELGLWRERYGVGLTLSEDAFAKGSSRLAERKRRNRRVATGAFVAAALAVAAITSALWRRAEQEALRAEASKLLALGQMQLESYPTAALAYVIQSLELTDTPEARLFALRVLQHGPVATMTPQGASGAFWRPAFSADDQWLAFGGWNDVEVFRRDGGAPLRLHSEPAVLETAFAVGFGRDSKVVVGDRGGEVRVWSLPDGRDLRSERFEEGPSWLFLTGDGFVTSTIVGPDEVYRRWPFGSGESRVIGTMIEGGPGDVSLDLLVYAGSGPEAAFTFAARNSDARNLRRKIYLRSLDDWTSKPKLLVEQPADVNDLALSPDGQRFATSDESGEIRIGFTRTPAARPVRILRGRKADHLRFDSTGTKLAGRMIEGGHTNLVLWDLTAPPAAEPWVFGQATNGVEFDSSGRWLAATQPGGDTALWFLDESYPLVLNGHERPVTKIAFTPDGKYLVSASQDGTVRSWPLLAAGNEESRVLLRTDLFFPSLVVDPTSRNVLVSTGRGKLLVVPLTGEPARQVADLEGSMGWAPVAMSEGGRFIAIASSPIAHEAGTVRIWDLETGEERALPQAPGVVANEQNQFGSIRFLGQDRLLANFGAAGLLMYDLRQETVRTLGSQPRWWDFTVSGDGELGFGVSVLEGDERRELVRFRVDGLRPPETLPLYGLDVDEVALDPTNTRIATGSTDGTVRIGPVSGEAPHVLLGHEGAVLTVAFSPDGRRLASAGGDGTIRLWPVPDVTKTAPHVRPYREFLAKLRAWTNLRVSPDPQATTGWKLEVGPFPGWAQLPTW
jgi:WD40 repeat protein